MTEEIYSYVWTTMAEQTTASIIYNDRRIINGWAFYDWANSAYFLVISTAIFPAYFLNYSPDFIPFFGFYVSDSAFYSLIVSLAYLVIAFTPIIGNTA